MSAYLICKAELTKSEVLAGLAQLGFTEEQILIQDGQNLYGYHGDIRPEKSDITIRRKHLTNSSNDLGFQRGADGKFKMIVSQYDKGALVRKFKGTNTTFESLFKQAVGVGKTVANAKKKRYRVNMPKGGLQWGTPIRLSLTKGG